MTHYIFVGGTNAQSKKLVDWDAESDARRSIYNWQPWYKERLDQACQRRISYDANHCLFHTA